MPILLVCKTCQAPFEEPPSVVKSGKGKYCSKKCVAEYLKTLKGSNNPNWRGGQPLGKCLECKEEYKIVRPSLKDTSKFCSSECRVSHNITGKPQPHLSGKNNWNWKGGITPNAMRIRKSIKYKQWRKAVFERDNYTCLICKDNSGGNLQADHIKPFSLYPKLRFDVNNGRTLCKSCHSKYGWMWYRESIVT